MIINTKVIQSLRLQIESMKEDIFNKQIILNSLESKLKEELKEFGKIKEHNIEDEEETLSERYCNR